MKEQKIQDSDMHRRVVAAVEKALATADPARVFRSDVEGAEYTRCPWTLRTSGDLIAGTFRSGDVTSYVLEHNVPGDVNARLSLSAFSDDPGEVRWWPGRDAADAAGFLANWEHLIDQTALGLVEAER